VYTVSHINESVVEVTTLWKEKVGAASSHPEALVVKVMAPRMKKPGATTRFRYSLRHMVRCDPLIPSTVLRF
jgi:hypothetical protein